MIHSTIARIASFSSRLAHKTTHSQRRAAVFFSVAGAGLAACVWLAPTSWASPSATSPSVSADTCDAGAQ